MNKYLILILTLFSAQKGFSQNIVIEIDTFQFFSHTIQVQTIEAIKNDLIFYEEFAVGMNKYSFDTTNNLLYHESFKNGKTYSRIINKHKSENLLDVDVLYANGVIVNYVITEMEEYGNVLIARYFSSDKQKIQGWFSFGIKIH